MAENTRAEVIKAYKKRAIYLNDYISRFCSLYHNSFEFENLPDDLPKRYLMRTLLRRGSIAYDRKTDTYLRYVGIGVDLYGLPTEYEVYGFNGFVARRYPDDVVILRINDLSNPILPYLQIQCAKLVEFDMAIEQNLEAVKTMTIAEVADDKQALTLKNMANARRVGATIIYINKKATMGNAINVQNTGAQYLVNEMLRDKQVIKNEILTNLGIPVANTDKRERVQGLEITASIGETSANIFTCVDTFNYDAEVGGLPIRMKANTDIEDIKNKIMTEGQGNGENKENPEENN